MMVVSQKSDNISIDQLDGEVISFARHLSFVNVLGDVEIINYSKIVSNIKQAENHLKSGRKVIFSFVEVESVSFEVVAYLIGNIECFVRMYGRGKIHGTYSKFPEVNQTLHDSGFFDIMKAKLKFGAQVPSKDILNLKFISSTFVNAETISPLRAQVIDSEVKLKKTFEHKIFRALSESMLNVHHHAYFGAKYSVGKYKKIKGLWWLGATIDKAENTIEFVMYDAGMGIPASMPRNYKSYIENFKPTGGAFSDADLIYLATQKGKTSTYKKHRGRGLPDMHQMVKDDRGEMRIFSGYGHYVNNGNVYLKTNLPAPSHGTLVLWKVYIESLKDQMVKNV